MNFDIIKLCAATICLLLCSTINAQSTIIGAYYFDGWSGTNKVMDEEWSINAPTHLTKKLASHFQERKPIWGWRDDTLSIMEEQIKLASKNGIDFFSFCWYWKNDNNEIDTAKISQYPLNTSIRLFMHAKNKKKMKFSLVVANHQGSRIKTEKDWLDAVDYWSSHYFCDPQYLMIDGKPVINIFSCSEVNKLIPTIRRYVKTHTPYKDLFIISNNYIKSDNNFDMLSWYVIKEREPKHAEERDYKQLVNYVEKTWNSVDTCFHIAPCVMVNWDNRPWKTIENGLYYTDRTPELFKQHIKNALLFSRKNSSTPHIVFIYVWNELGEGGYLVPTAGDKNATYLKQIKKVKKYT